MSTAVLVGSPRPRSSTYRAAVAVAEALTGSAPDLVIDLADLGPRLFDSGDVDVATALAGAASHDLLVVASPTYKATYTGLLKVFLDRLPAGALQGVDAVPLMLGGHWRHALAPELALKPVLSELGARLPTRALFLLDTAGDEAPELQDWLAESRPRLARSYSGAHAVGLG